jgi:hypothetical protein
MRHITEKVKRQRERFLAQRAGVHVGAGTRPRTMCLLLGYATCDATQATTRFALPWKSRAAPSLLSLA